MSTNWIDGFRVKLEHLENIIETLNENHNSMSTVFDISHAPTEISHVQMNTELDISSVWP